MIILRAHMVRDQICFPEIRKDLCDRTLQKYLDLVGLGHLTERSQDEIVDWKRELSKGTPLPRKNHMNNSGEQQRLVMARLFYHRPKFALLDERYVVLTQYHL